MTPSVHVASGTSWGLFPSRPLSVFSVESYCLWIHDSNKVNATHPHPHPSVSMLFQLALSVTGEKALACVGMYRKGSADSSLTCKHLSEFSRHKRWPAPIFLPIRYSIMGGARWVVEMSREGMDG